MQVTDLDIKQRSALTNMTLELMSMGVMWGLQPENRQLMLDRSQRPGAHQVSVADIIRDLMGDFPHHTADIKPSAFNDFLETLT